MNNPRNHRRHDSYDPRSNFSELYQDPMDISTPRASSSSSEMDRLKRENDHLKMVIKKHEYEADVQRYILNMVRNPRGFFHDSGDVLPNTYASEAVMRMEKNPERYFLNSYVMAPGTPAHSQMKHIESLRHEAVRKEEMERIEMERRRAERKTIAMLPDGWEDRVHMANERLVNDLRRRN